MQPTLWCKDATQRKATPTPAHAPGLADDAGRLLVCRHCGAAISDSGALFPMGGDKLTHVFSNPYGKLHELVTARRAQGLILQGPASAEFTWFPGYVWEIAYCAGCRAHLGWQFTAERGDTEPQRFYGLLVAEVVEAS